MNNNQQFYSKGNTIKRVLTSPLLFLAWFAPHKMLRVFFHRLRGVNIGKNVEIGYFCIIGNVHPNIINIGDNSVITARTTILDHDNSMYYTGRGDVLYGGVSIGKNVFIGIGSVIMPNVIIHDNVIVGALSFVNKSVSCNSIIGGVPAKVLSKD